MKTYFYILLIILSLGCTSQGNKKKNTSDLTKNTELDTNRTVQSEIKRNQDELDLFIHKLKQQPIASLPFEMDSYLLKNNNFNGDYFDWLEDLTTKGRTNDFPILNNKTLFFNKSINEDSINHITAPYISSYYYLLIHESDISSFYFYKRLKPINENIEIFLNSSIISKNENEIRGVIFKLNVLDLQKKKIINSYLLKITGIGLNDESFIEGFLIDENYNLKIKNYTSVEGESIEILKELKINSNGHFDKELVKVKITSKERGETFIENFNKEITH